ncbi:MAG: ABC transporter ATP-binding protein [Lachnospiraceae bacterium]|nr:ABC transporter ATP-binding protein [Lachnospiraceae bacterium]
MGIPAEISQDIAIEVKNLCIGYKNIQAYSIKKSLLKFKKSHVEEFQAVKDVSFTVRKGEILGIIGKNGSGKSTMLKALAGIFNPDQGSIDMKDNTVSLMAIGVGFQKEVTGRENILLSGMLLGFSEEEIRAKMPEIIAFADLGRFIDMPVKTYSSGMHSKLAFSITAVLETEIMLIDEVLSVGDANFKKKSYAKMKELISSRERTVIIVSHNIETLKSLCDRVMWMHEGEIKRIGNPVEVLDEYEEFMQ